MVKRGQPAWICCQIGAREQYSIPRALHSIGLLSQLVTDAWVPPHHPGRWLPGMHRLSERYHPDLQDAAVRGFTPGWLGLEVNHRWRKTDAWTRILARNTWFQRRAIAHLRHLPSDQHPILFSYSYAARDLGRFAKQRGWPFVLGQIDPGRKAEQQWQQFPAHYWENWLEECALADQIVVNSDWSAQWLQAEGIPAEKLITIPLVYEPSEAANQFQRQYPERFTEARPLRVLFLGQAIARKGIHELLQAARLLSHYPIQFTLVGSADPILAATYPQTNLHWVGTVPHGAVDPYYQQADLFLFPTHSDGFGRTQLEAQSWKLPIIASRSCGSVVRDHVNGLLLSEVTPEAIAQTLLTCLNNPPLLTHLSAHSTLSPEFRFSHLQQQLRRISSSLLGNGG